MSILTWGRKRRAGALRDMPLLAGLDERQILHIAALTRPVAVREGEVLVEEGWRGHEFFFVVEGTASVTVDGEEVASLEPRSWFGEKALIRDCPRTATITATTPMTLLAMGRRSFLKLLSTMPEVAERLTGRNDEGPTPTPDG